VTQDGKKRKSRITLPFDFGIDGGSLIDARRWAEKQRELVLKGINPTLYARHEKARRVATQQHTFKAVTDEWLEHNKDSWSPRHYKKAEGIVRRVLRPTLGERLIGEIFSDEILAAVEVPQQQGKHETAHKALEFAKQIFNRASLRQLIQNDPTYPLKSTKVLKPVHSKKQPHLKEPQEVAELLQKIRGYQARHFSVRFALRILPYLFTRPGELRQAKWGEFDLANAQWIVPAERMKMRKPHTVPLATQVIALLEELALHSRYDDDSLLFPSPTNQHKPISDATLSKALRTMGYQDKHVPHGFRHTASTLLNAQRLNGQPQFNRDAIECQLAHADQNRIRATYNQWEYMPDRIEMMQFYADLLDTLRSGNGNNVLAFKGNKQ